MARDVVVRRVGLIAPRRPPRPRREDDICILLHGRRRRRRRLRRRLVRENERRAAIPKRQAHAGIRRYDAEDVRVHDERAGVALRGIVYSGGLQGVRRARRHERGSDRVRRGACLRGARGRGTGKGSVGCMCIIARLERSFRRNNLLSHPRRMYIYFVQSSFFIIFPFNIPSRET